MRDELIRDDDLRDPLVAQADDLRDGSVAEAGGACFADGGVSFGLRVGVALSCSGEALGRVHARSLENLTADCNPSIKLDMSAYGKISDVAEKVAEAKANAQDALEAWPDGSGIDARRRLLEDAIRLLGQVQGELDDAADEAVGWR